MSEVRRALQSVILHCKTKRWAVELVEMRARLVQPLTMSVECFVTTKLRDSMSLPSVRQHLELKEGKGLAVIL